jgi:hypothetical protein
MSDRTKNGIFLSFMALLVFIGGWTLGFMYASQSGPPVNIVPIVMHPIVKLPPRVVISDPNNPNAPPGGQRGTDVTPKESTVNVGHPKSTIGAPSKPVPNPYARKVVKAEDAR